MRTAGASRPFFFAPCYPAPTFLRMSTARVRVAATAAIVAVLPIAALSLFTPFYQTNDDIAMRLLAEGNFVPGDEPLPFLMFINVILGKVMSLAYRLTTAVPWYDVILGGSMLVAAAALVSVWIGSGKLHEILWAVLLTAYFLLPTFVSVQFSLAGMGCAAAGVALIATARLRLGVALFFLGSLIRFEGAVLIAIEGAALALPLLASRARDGENRVRPRNLVIAAGLAVLLAGGAFVVNQVVYRRASGWQNFYEYNLLRSRLNEYITPERLAGDAIPRLTKEVGWTGNDFALFRNWFFTDPQLFSLEKVRHAERVFYGTANPPAEDWRKVRTERAKAMAKAFFLETRWAFLLMGAVVLAYGLRPKLLLYFAALVLTLAVLIVGISLSLKAPPQRIFWPMLILAATMLVLASRRWGRPMPHVALLVALLLGVYAITLALPPLWKESETRRLAAEAAHADVDGLQRTGAKFFVLHADAFPYEDFWQPLRTENAAFDFVGLGASARTPPVQDFLTKSGRSDLPWSLCNDPSMLIIARPPIPPMLETFVREHRGVNVQFTRAFEGKDFTAWRCQRI
jgi:hypothetical protein